MSSSPPSTVPPASDGSYSGDKLIIFTAIFIPVQIFCVAMRYVARYVIKGPWGFDDLVVLTSLLLQLALAGISIGSVKNAGVGYHIPYLEANAPEKVPLWGKYLVAISFIYFGGINIPKLAILALYHRLFPRKDVRLVVHIMMAALIGLTISTLVTAIVACRPFAANWNPALPGAHCIDKEGFFIWGSIPNIVTDIIMLIIPIPIIWKLNTSVRLKIGLTVTFAVGSFGLITSIIRFTTFFRNNSFIDGTWSAVDLIIWTQVEAGVYLISACLPTCRPLLERIGPGRFVRNLTGIRKTKDPHSSHRSEESGTAISLKQRGSMGPLSMSSRGFHRLGNDGTWQDPGILVTTDIGVNEEDAEGRTSMYK